jgi:hypothetical protein
MGFFTSLTYYRPGRPPTVTGRSFARFLGRIIETNLVEPCGLIGLKIKFGKAIDQNRRDAHWSQAIGLGLSESREIEWDATVPASRGFAGLINEIADNDDPIYRAYASLGNLVEAVREPITILPPVKDAMGYWPDGLSISLGPVRPSGLQTGGGWLAGWIEMSFSGNGYLYPSTLSKLVTRAIDSPEITRLCEICRTSWPVPSHRPSIVAVMRRKKFKSLWPYDNFRKSYDWYWSVHETG